MANMISNNNNNSIGGGGGSDAEVFNYNSNNLAMHNKPATTNNAVNSSRSNNNNQTNNSSGIGSSLSSSVGGGGGVTTLRDVSSFLQTPEANQVILPPGVNPYDHIIDMLRGLDLEDDGILMNQKVKNIETFFCNVVRTEQMLCESMEYINDKALDDQEAALKFAILFSSHNFDSLAMKETKVRSAMIKILETNFLNADTYRQYDKNRLYNSITLLGEYYHRVRLANNTPINILGESLLTLLIREFEETPAISVKLAKLILSQITLNGDNMRKKHKDELTQLLFHIRRNLIEQPNLKAKVKALLLMTLDLYYCNFKNIGKQLEEMYRKYLVQVDDEQDDEEEAAAAVQVAAAQSQRESLGSTQSQQQQQKDQQLQSQKSVTNSFENGDLSNSSSLNDYNDVDTSLSGGGKKWSEQVCEDSFYEQEYSLDNLNNSGSGPNDPLNTSFSESGHHQRSSSSRSFDQYEGDRESIGRDSRRSYQFRTSPRPLKKDYSEERQDAAHWQNDGNNPMMSNGNGDMPEDRDQTKPLPRWRNTRFNRDGKDQQQQRGDRQHYQGNRRYSQQYDDDRQSERSEGGSIRLYSINDRLKHSQEKFDRNNMSYNIANWDRHSQRDDRSERSYLSNYERGSSRRGARHYNNNRQNYDKPPRFQKQSQNQQQQQQQQHHQNQNRGGDQKIQSETWRRSGGGGGGHNYRGEHNNNGGPGTAYRSNGGGVGPDDNESQRSSSRARTLPRPAKSKIDGGDNSYHQQQQRHHQQRGGQRGGQQHHNNNRRYGSQNSLTSEGSNTLERRHHNQQHHRGGGGGGGHHNYRNHRTQDWNDDRHHGGSTHSLNRAERAPSSVSDKNWQGHEGPAVGGGIASDEVVREAQQTTKYMNYLSSKK